VHAEVDTARLCVCCLCGELINPAENRRRIKARSGIVSVRVDKINRASTAFPNQRIWRFLILKLSKVLLAVAVYAFPLEGWKLLSPATFHLTSAS
jgi:hypothetical protein